MSINRIGSTGFALLLAIAGAAWGADSSVPTDFATLQAAVDDAGTVAGDTITLEAGTHAETAVHVTKSVTIAGTGIGSSILDNTGGIGIYPDADGVTIRDLTIDGGSQAVRFEMALGTIDGTTLDSVEMSNQGSRGIEVHNNTTVTNLLVTGSRFDDVGTGLRVASSAHVDGVQFLDSEFADHSIGIYEANDGGTSTMRDVLVRNSSFHDMSSYGIFVEEIQDALIEDNTFEDNFRDIQIFKWYQASVPVSNVLIRNNTSSGATNACFAIFNAEHSSGQTEFDGVRYVNNRCAMADGATRAVYSGAHSATTGSGGIGWGTVQISCNDFTGAYGFGVDYFDPVAVDGDTLGGATLAAAYNWWGTADPVAVAALMEEPSITDYQPFLTAPFDENCPPPQAFVDHFMCYDVKELSSIGKPVVTVEDQFLAEGEITVKKAKQICVPANKNGEGILNADVHLVCYDAKPDSDADSLVGIFNQFGEQTLEVKKSKLLCVPSYKEILDDDDDSDSDSDSDG